MVERTPLHNGFGCEDLMGGRGTVFEKVDEATA